jgi:hypothetical protein
VTARPPSRADLDAATAATAAAMAGPAASPLDRMQAAEAGEALYEAAARAAGRPLPGCEPALAQLREYVSQVSVPGFGDGGRQSLHAAMRQPESEPEPEAGL